MLDRQFGASSSLVSLTVCAVGYVGAQFSTAQNPPPCGRAAVEFDLVVNLTTAKALGQYRHRFPARETAPSGVRVAGGYAAAAPTSSVMNLPRPHRIRFRAPGAPEALSFTPARASPARTRSAIKFSKHAQHLKLRFSGKPGADIMRP
jgi:hypothetical protein